VRRDLQCTAARTLPIIAMAAKPSSRRLLSTVYERQGQRSCWSLTPRTRIMYSAKISINVSNGGNDDAPDIGGSACCCSG
jgi:hypothetical protein